MTFGLRWRILTGWTGVVIALLVLSVVTLETGLFIRGRIHSELAAQHIMLPPHGDPRLSPGYEQTGGRQVDDGTTAAAQAQVIERDVLKATGGKTFSEISTLARQAPNDANLQSQRRTALDGSLLAHSLEDAWIWWTVATAMFVGGLILMAMAAGALVALIFEWRHT